MFNVISFCHFVISRAEYISIGVLLTIHFLWDERGIAFISSGWGSFLKGVTGIKDLKINCPPH